MAKIGILTFHDGINHGAFLQAYALQNFLLKNGHDNEIINYKSLLFTFNEYKCFVRPQKPINLYNNIRKILKFKLAHRKMKRTKRVFTPHALEKISFDDVIVGSDSVWNYSNAFSGFDPVYFSSGLSSSRLFSYAASFGPDTCGDDYPQVISSLLKRFDAISVRDANSKKFAESLTGQKATLVLDPVFLYDFEQEVVECKHDNFILVYALGLGESQAKEVIEFAKKVNKKVISIGYKNKEADINIVSVSPFEWLGFFKKADFVVTSMYHGTLFSLKYNKQFCTLGSAYRRNKLEQFLIDIGLQDRFICLPDLIEKTLSDNIEYGQVGEQIQKRRMISEKFLRDALNERQ